MQYIKKTSKERSQYRARLTKLAKSKLSNPREQFFKNLCLGKDFRAIHQGWPDFMVLDSAGNFKAFVEVKRFKNEKLRFPQMLFRRICKLHNIPYFIWTEKDDLPPELYR